MKIAVSSTGTDLSATIDERFGRCRYFLLIDTEDMSVDVIANPNAELTTSAGIQSASLVANAGAGAVITGNCGPKAMQVFSQTSIRVILGQRGVIRDVMDKHKKGALDAPISANVPEASGGSSAGATQAARGLGGRGSGRCMGGCGGGMGMGRRCNRTDRTAAAGSRNATRCSGRPTRLTRR